MNPLSALRARLYRHERIASRPPVRRFDRTRLRLENLEDRTVPTVYTIANGDVSGLIAAINASNTNNLSDTINLAAGGTYTFSTVADATDGGSALPTILTDTALSTNTLTINGNGATLARSTAGGTPFFRFLREAVASGTFNAPTVTVNNVSFSNGTLDPASTNSSVIGGAVLLAGGSLTLADCTFTGNQAPSGGALAANQVSTTPRPLNVTHCTFTSNTSTKSAGGAIYNISSSTLTIANSTFTSNTSTAEGGAVRVQTSNTTTTINGSTFATNTANGGNGGGAIFIQGPTNIDTTTVRDNVSAVGGGGVWNQGVLTVTNSTISNNRANDSTASGGGIYVQGNFTLQNSTIIGNRAGNGGGVSYALGGNSASVTFSTIANNSIFFGIARGGGIQIGGSNLSLGDSVIAGNNWDDTVTSGSGPDVYGTVNSTGYNFIGKGNGATINGTTTGNQVGTIAAPLNPQLGSLQANGGPTATCLPLAGSPLINTGDPAIAPPPAGDQRGMPRVQYGRVDIGATESGQTQVMAATINSGALQRSMVNQTSVTFSTTVTFAGSPSAAFVLTRTGPGSPTGAVTVTVDLTGSTATQTIAKLTFSGALTQSGSLVDGNYQLTILGNQISANGLALDGDGDGFAGGDNVSTFHRLFGDSNGDRTVDNADFFAFRGSFLQTSGQTGYLAYFDFNGDAAVDNADFFAFRSRFLTGI